MTAARATGPAGPVGAVVDPALPVEVLAPGTVLLRVHQARFAVDQFNPGHGPRSRFAFFGDPPVPVLYAGATAEVAVFESVFHDTVPGSIVRSAQWRDRVLSAMESTRELRLAKLHSDGLRRLGLHARDLTDTLPTAYATTVQWAALAHRQGLDGCVWMSRQFNTERAFVLFGDRVAPGSLTGIAPHPQQRVFASPTDEAWLAEVADRIDVTLLLR